MRIAVNGMAIRQRNGTGRYSRELIRALLPIVARKGDEMVVLLPGDVEPPDFIPSEMVMSFGRSSAYWHYRRMPQTADKEGFDVLHNLCHFYPARTRAAGVVTVHDLACLDNRSYCDSVTYLKFRAMARTSVENAYVIAPSEFTAERIKHYFGATAHVVPHGANHLQFTPSGGDCLLSVGDTIRRKGSDLLDELEKLVRLERFVDGEDDELINAYSGALALVSLSRYEGFGLNVAEAAYNGLPIVAPGLPAYREILGDDYPFLSEGTPVSAANMARRLTDDDFWKELSDMCRNRLRPYTWERAAEETYAVYETAASG